MVPELEVRPKLNNSNPNRGANNLKFRCGNWQFETPRPCTPGIDVQDATSLLDGRPVRMPRNNHSKPGCFRVQIQFRKVVQDVYQNFARLQDFELRHTLRPVAAVIVSTYCGNGRNCS